MNKLFTVLIAILMASCTNNTNMDKKETTKADIIYFKSGYSDVNGLKMYYEIYGKGEPLVLIHGGGSTIQTSFGRIIPLLSKRRQIIAIELQGHGHTADIDRPESFEQDADDVATLIKNLNMEKADFFGFSNGGNTTMQIAVRHPEIVHKIILGSAFFKRDGMDPGFWESMEHASLDNMPKQLKEEYVKVAPDSNGLIKMFEKDKNRMIEFKDWDQAVLQSIKVPTFIISGDKDVMSPEHAVEMYRLIPNAQLAILPVGHGEYMGEVTTLTKDNDNKDYQFFISMVEEFLDKK